MVKGGRNNVTGKLDQWNLVLYIYPVDHVLLHSSKAQINFNFPRLILFSCLRMFSSHIISCTHFLIFEILYCPLCNKASKNFAGCSSIIAVIGRFQSGGRHDCSILSSLEYLQDNTCQQITQSSKVRRICGHNLTKQDVLTSFSSEQLLQMGKLPR